MKPKEIPSRLRDLRRARGYTQQELGLLVGVREATISSWETGVATPRQRNQRQLARRLGVNVAELGFSAPLRVHKPAIELPGRPRRAPSA